MPANLEGYYQEIGRDGLPAHAILMHSFADRKTHEFLLEKGDPEPPVLDGVFAHLQRAGGRCRTTSSRIALEQLWVHGGARFDERGDVVPGSDAIRLTYARQRRHRFAQLDAMSRYSDGARCRMATLVAHFGDAADAERPCEQCDVCRGAVKRTFVVYGATSRRRVRAPREKRPLGGEGESALHRALRAWRMQMAKTDKVPAFCVLTNRTLDSIVTNRPRSHAALYACSGVGSELLEKYGDAILAIVERAGERRASPHSRLCGISARSFESLSRRLWLDARGRGVQSRSREGGIVMKRLVSSRLVLGALAFVGGAVACASTPEGDARHQAVTEELATDLARAPDVPVAVTILYHVEPPPPAVMALHARDVETCEGRHQR